MSRAIGELVHHLKSRQKKPTWHLLHAIVGGLCGVVATGPMTALMTRWHRQLPLQERYPLPPRQITMNLARRVGLSGDMNEDVRSAATILAHFGYGAVTGVIYSALARQTRLGTATRGMSFGLLVWLVSYLGLLPETGLLASAFRHPRRRNALMIGAHLVWGLVLSLLEETLQPHARGLKAGAREL